MKVPLASPLDTVRALGTALLPVVARGAVVRRTGQVDLAERLDLDRRLVRELQRLRDRYGRGPLRLRVPLRRVTLVLDPDDAQRVLEESPDPFALDTREKRAALRQFEPEGVLVSPPSTRRARRALNEEALDTGCPRHRAADRLTAVVREEVARLQPDGGEVDWDAFVSAWFRTVRRVLLGDGAADDTELTDTLLALRRRANWSYLAPVDRRRRAAFLERLQQHVDRAEPGSLVSLLPADDPTAVQQVPQWLFASDAVAWSSFRALALLLGHPAAASRARAEGAPYLRACLLESLRLYPTTPALLRDTRTTTTWPTGTLPPAALVVLAPFFHRDGTRVPEADRFDPDVWLEERDRPFWPFSAGPGTCPGREVVLLLGGALLDALLARAPEQTAGARLTPDGQLPGSASPFRLRFSLAPSAPVPART